MPLFQIFFVTLHPKGCETRLRLGNWSKLHCSRLARALPPANPKKVRIMTTFAQRISETPMAPYAALLRSMTREQKQIVVTFITESMEEPKAKRQVPAEFKKLRGIVNITEEDMARDEHLAHIMGR